jgi:hypothetical protein
MHELISSRKLEQSKQDEKFVLLTAQQVKKDFAMFGMDVDFSGNLHFAYQELFQQLNVHIENLLNTNYEKLKSLLYQIDLSEKELTRTDQDLQFSSISELITHKILERELKKVLIREYFKEKGQ